MDTPIDIDLALWSSASNENPVYYVQYAHARLSALARNAAELGLIPDTAHLELLSHDKEGTLMRTIGEFPRVLKTAASLREPHRVCRYLEDLAGDYHRFYDSCRVLPQGDEQPDRPAHRAAGAVPGDPPGHRQRAGDPRRHRPGANVNAHPAGPRHAEDTAPRRAPRHGRSPPRSCCCWRRMCGRATLLAATTASLRIAGVAVTDLAQEYGTPLFVIDEDDFRSRCRDIASAFGGGEHVHYAAKAFLCTEIARWIDEEGLSLDVCSGGELAVALHADFPPERIALHGNNKSVAELTAAVESRRRPRRARLDDRDRAPRRHRRRGGRRSGRSRPRHRRRRGAHPRVHLHRARGPEVRPVAGQRCGAGRGAPGVRAPTTCDWSVCTATSVRRSSTSPASRSPRTA